MEQKKIEEIIAMLPTILKKGLLTDIECRLIVSSKNPLENEGRNKGAVYKIIESKTKEEAAILTETFGAMPLAVKANSKIMHSAYSNEEINNSISLPSENPFLNNTVIMHLFGFLPLHDMKKSRLVCRQWNSTAEICLRKRSLIRFDPDDLLPSTFIEMSKYSHPDLPFPSFAFYCLSRSHWLISDIQDFIVKWGKNIKEMTFNTVTLASKCNSTNKEVSISKYDLNLLFINPSNITSLKVQYRVNRKTKLEISLEKFVSIKNLSLHNCRIILPAESQRTLIAPVNIDFQSITVIRNGKISTHFYYNDVVDFSKALVIYLKQLYGESVALLDMSHQVLNVNTLQSTGFNVSLKNLAQAKGDVQYLKLNFTNSPFEEKTYLKIKELEACYSKINLSALPQTLEFLKWSNGEIFCREPLKLPNLKYLHIMNYVEDIVSLQFFSNCANLEELAIDYSWHTGTYTFSLYRLPKNVKRMSIPLCPIQFVDNYPSELDTLILKCLDRSSIMDCIAITTQIKAKVLVVYFDTLRNINTSHIVKLVMANQKSKKILIGSDVDLHKKTPFKGSDLSKWVDKKSNFYRFENQVGKSITAQEFKRYAKSIFERSL